MRRSMLHPAVLLLTLTSLTLSNGQYYDVFQGLQQIFQPYHQAPDLLSQYHDVSRYTGTNRQTNRQENKKKTETTDRHTKKTPLNRHDSTHTTTTPKPSRKTTKANSSQSNTSKHSNIRKFNSDIIFRDFDSYNFEMTTKRNRVTTSNRPKTTTTVAPLNNMYNIHKTMPENAFDMTIYDNSYNRPVAENYRHFNTDIVFKDDDMINYGTTTKRNRVTPNNRVRTTTTKSTHSFYNFDRPTTEKPRIISDQNRRPVNFNRPVTENLYENKHQNENYGNRQINYDKNRRIDSNLGYNNNNFNNMPANNWNTNSQNINNNNKQNNKYPNNSQHNDNFEKPTNNRNPDVIGINTQNIPNGNNNFGTIVSGFSNTGDNRGDNKFDNSNSFNTGNNRGPTNNFNNGNDRVPTNHFNNGNDRVPTHNFNNGNVMVPTNNFNNGNVMVPSNNFNTGNDRVPTNNFNIGNDRVPNNNNFYNDNNRGPTNNFNNGNNRVPTNNFSNVNNRVPAKNYGSSNNRGIINTDYDGSETITNNPLLNRPGVKPVPVDVNKPPITNKPITEAAFNDRFGTYTESPDNSPEILIGPDEDDMSEAQKKRYLDLADKMCESFKSLNFKEIVALPLLPSPDPIQVNVSSCAPVTAPLVIGGKVATINEFPHMAVVGWKKIRATGYAWKCGGSLVSDQYVLTAGHCTYQDKDYEVESGPPQAVQLGSSYLDDPGALVVKISAVIRHPKYKQRRSYYDVALIKLAEIVKFTEVIRPACLGDPPAVGRSIVATGWGRTEFGGEHSVELRSVSVSVWDMRSCRDIWGTSLKLPSGPAPHSHVCAGDRSGGKDTCQGDSGGPAQIQDGCVWRVVAVTSYGRSCGAPNTPALYAITQRVFVAAQVFEDQGQGDQGLRDQREPSFENRRESVSNGRPGFSDTIEPNYSVYSNYRIQ